MNKIKFTKKKPKLNFTKKSKGIIKVPAKTKFNPRGKHA